MVLSAWLGLAWAQAPLDLNGATAEQLDGLPGVGPAKALAFVLWRAESGPCRDVDALLAVPGWGEGTLAGVRTRVTCGDGTPEPGAVTDPTLDAPVLHTVRIDINRAGPYELVELPGISLARAHDIIAYRDANGLFASCSDLTALPGVGKATLALLGDHCIAIPGIESEARE